MLLKQTKMIRTIYLLCLAVVFTFSLTTVIAQNSISISKEWSVYKIINGVEISIKMAEYQSQDKNIHQQLYLIKLKNTTNKAVTVSGLKELWFGANCRSCNLTSPNEYEFRTKLNPNQTISGKIESKNSELRVFAKDLKFAEHQLPRLELSNLKAEF